MEKNETNYIDASAPPGLVAPQGIRQSHLCCGCCCDTRRATIVVNIISASFASLGILALAFFVTPTLVNSVDDDEVKQDLAEASKFAWVGILILCSSVLCSGTGIYGALKYNGTMVLVAGVWYSVNSLFNLLGGDVIGAIMSGFFAYPHFVLHQEMKKGIMTEINYPNEKHSCCCV